jgi:hypothetical protein
MSSDLSSSPVALVTGANKGIGIGTATANSSCSSGPGVAQKTPQMYSRWSQH